ncbi:GCN5-related N-acetyltransferase [Granulicella sibirica]|uniref:GCN5-related N-acetyltransferase n=1 Tax=Granulicella sibirica TaxID=2479048 RepID=A0A4Q0SZL4_9BACT|nr:GCN5-related N-acetyltransferase [Granulicella sibirica]
MAETHGGEFLGCAAIHRYGTHLAEVRSIATRLEARGLGAGGMLLQRVLEDVRNSGTQRACLFTRIPSFFARYGFHTVPLASMRDKVAKDCVHCARRERCDEIAMVAGEPPIAWPVAARSSSGGLVQIGQG